jgi:hypothetical protein
MSDLIDRICSADADLPVHSWNAAICQYLRNPDQFTLAKIRDRFELDVQNLGTLADIKDSIQAGHYEVKDAQDWFMLTWHGHMTDQEIRNLLML